MATKDPDKRLSHPHLNQFYSVNFDFTNPSKNKVNPVITEEIIK